MPTGVYTEVDDDTNRYIERVASECDITKEQAVNQILTDAATKWLARVDSNES